MAYGLMSNLMRGIRPVRTRMGDSRLQDVPNNPMVAPAKPMAAGRGLMTRAAAALRKRRKKEM